MGRAASAKVDINKTAIDALPIGGRIVDSKISGFMARRLPSGKVAYGYRYRMKGKPQKWVSLGIHGHAGVTATTARNAALSLQGKVADRIDPVAETKAANEKEAHDQRVKANTVNVVLDEFLREYLPGAKLRTADRYGKVFDAHVRPEIGTISIYALTRDDINPMLRKIANKAGPAARDKALAFLRKALNWYQIQDSRFQSPIVKGMAGTTTKRKRVLDDEELRAVWTALESPEAGPDAFRRLVRMLLLAGQRRTNTARMRSDTIKDGNVWKIDDSEHKNKETQFVPLTPAALEWINVKANGYFFSTDGGERPFSAYSKGKKALDAVITAQRKEVKKKPLPNWTLHDLRRTARTLMSRAGVPGDIGEIATGHKLKGVREVYDQHTFIAEKRDAMDRLAALLQSIINPPAGNVVKMAGRS